MQEQQFGPYIVTENLGGGAMGVVYRVLDSRNGEMLALKTVRGPSLPFLSAIRREIHALSRLHHPGLMRILDHGIENGMPWYTMPIVKGMTLRRRLQQGPIPESEWIPMAQELCNALGILHGEGIVHRDLKPENILIDESGRPILTDFGLVAFSGMESSRELLDWGEFTAGAIAYLSPEQIRGEVVDARADMYALGCLLYEIVTGSPPFTGSTVREILLAHQEAQPQPPSSTSPAIASLVMRLLSREVSKRIGYAEDIAKALQDATGIRAPQPATPRVHLYRPGISGRTNELDVVRKMLRELDEGAGGLLWIGGESGVGKTRFLQEALREASRSGFIVLRGECSPDASAPLQAFRDPLSTLLERCIDSRDDEMLQAILPAAAALAPYHPSLAEFPGLRNLPSPADLPADAAQIRVFHAISALLESAAGIWPVVLALDDVQWADELTAGFLNFMLRGWKENKELLVLCAYRLEETPAWLLPLIAAKSSIELKRLDDHAVAAMVEDMLGLKTPQNATIGRLFERSGGNPFFVAEYLRAAASQGLLQRDPDGRWDISATVLQVELPGSIQGLIERRLSLLSEGAQGLMETAAVLGLHAAYDLLQHASQMDEPRWLEALDELFRRQVLEEEGGSRVRFVHDRIRVVVTSRIPLQRKPQLHRFAATALETLRKEHRSEFAAELAEHYECCGEQALAREYCFEAAITAIQRYAYQEAEKLLRKLLSLAPEPSESISAWKELADLLRVSGRLEDAMTACVSGLEVCRKHKDSLEEGRALGLLAAIYWPQGKLEEADRIASEALELHKQQSDKTGEAKTLTTLAAIRWSRGLFEDARRMYEDALRAHRDLGDRRQQGSDLSNLAVMDLDQGRLDDAARRFEEALSIQRETGDRRFQGVSLSNLANIRLYQDRKDEALQLFQQARDIQRQVCDRRSEGATLNNLAWMQMERKNWSEAQQLYKEALRAQREVGDRLFEAHTLRNLAQLQRESGGDLSNGIRMLDQAQRLFTGLQNQPGVALCLCERGHIALALRRAPTKYLKLAMKIASQAGTGSDSELGQTIARLQHAIAEQPSPRKKR